MNNKTYSVQDLLKEYKEFKKTLPDDSSYQSLGLAIEFIHYLWKKEYPDDLEEILDPGSESDQEADHS